MEAIFLIIGEIIFAMVSPIIALIVDAIAMALGSTASLLPGAARYQKTIARVARIGTLTLAAIATLLLSTLLIVNFVFFDEATGYVLSRLESRSGIVTQCEDIEGSLLTGKIALNDCTVRRATHPTSTFDLSVAEVGMDLRLRSIFGTATLDDARIIGLNGWVRAERRAEPHTEADEEHTDIGERPRREFEIRRLEVANAKLTLSGTNADDQPFSLPIEVTALHAEPLRSRLALFDLLFRANAAGRLADAPFELSSRPTEGGRQTTWRATDVPIADFGAVTGGALAWFRAGTVSVHVDDDWTRGESTEIDMDWRLNFRGIEVGPPPGTGRVTRFVSAPLTRYANRFDGEFPLAFSMVLNEDQFEYSSSLAAAGLWSAIGGAVNNALKLRDIDTESDEATGNTLKDTVKSVLDRVRKRDAPEDDAGD